MSLEIDAQTVAVFEAKLAVAGIAPTPADREMMLGMYAYFVPGIEAMYKLREARHELPALAFDAEPA